MKIYLNICSCNLYTKIDFIFLLDYNDVRAFELFTRQLCVFLNVKQQK